MPKKWTRETYDVLMDDGSEYLGITVQQRDHNRWPDIAVKHKWTEPVHNRLAVQFAVHSAGTRVGKLSMSFEHFIEHIDKIETVLSEEVNPTRPGTDVVVPSYLPESGPEPHLITG